MNKPLTGSQPPIVDPPPFLASEYSQVLADAAAFHVIPAPLECSVSYGSGTANGPNAILHASQALEVLLDTRGWAPGRLGIYTTPAVNCRQGVGPALAEIERTVGVALDLGALPVVLGGEHTVTLGAARAFHARFAQGSIGFLQFDAHADLRAAYEGDPLSHASVMRRVHELGFSLFQIGVRSFSPEDIAFRRVAGIAAVDAENLADPAFPPFGLPAEFPSKLYVTLDVDVLDPPIMPATGTPEPGGLGWYALLNCIERLTRGREIVGFDVVELAPIAGLHHADFCAAKLVYRLMGLASLDRA